MFDYEDEDYTPDNSKPALRRSNAMRRKVHQRRRVQSPPKGTDSDEPPQENPKLPPRTNRSLSVLHIPRSLKPKHLSKEEEEGCTKLERGGARALQPL